MAIRHRDPTNLAFGADHSHIPFEMTLVHLNTATAPAANSAAANVECFASTFLTRRRVDLWQATQVKLVAMPIANGNAAGAAIKLSYMLTEAATWSGTDAGCSLILGSTGGVISVTRDSGWQTLAAGARVACSINVLVGVAFGSQAPTISTLIAYFR